MLEFQYFEGCPNATETLKNVKELIDNGLIVEKLKVTEIHDVSEAEDLNFQGSPTLLFDDKDIYTEKVPLSYNYSCRVYTFEGKQTGILAKAFILKQIKKLQNDLV